jgi:hypothetical protein
MTYSLFHGHVLLQPAGSEGESSARLSFFFDPCIVPRAGCSESSGRFDTRMYLALILASSSGLGDHATMRSTDIWTYSCASPAADRGALSDKAAAVLKSWGLRCFFVLYLHTYRHQTMVKYAPVL